MKSIQSIHLFLVVLIAFGLTSCGKETEETTPIRKDVSETVFASGTLQADGLYRLTAQSSGYLTGLHFQEGDLITAGTLLAEIEDLDNQINVQSSDQLLQIAEQNAAPDGPLLVQAQKNIDIAKERMEQDRKTAARYKRLWESNSIAKIEYENAQLAFENSESNFEIALENYQKIQLDAKQQVIHNKTTSDLHRTGQGKTQVKAFSNGKVYKKYKEVGDFVRQGDVIAEIGDPTLLYALVNVDETNIARVQPGQKSRGSPEYAC
jgi:HlyD family secretion protein